MTNKVVIDRAVFSSAAAKELKLIAVAATGTDIIDREAAKEFGVRVCNVPGYATQSVAQFTLALILELATRAARYGDGRAVRRMAEEPCIQFAEFSGASNSGEKLGIIGYGDIGRAVAEDGTGIRFGGTDCGPPWLDRANPFRSSSVEGAVPASRRDHLALSVNATDEKSHQRGNLVSNEADRPTGQHGSRSVDR